jgi:hypothetical protein
MPWNSRKEDARMKRNWSVVIVYEDNMVREAAVKFCDHLVNRFWPGEELDVEWRSFESLEAAPSLKQTTGKAAEADLIVFSTRPTGNFPSAVELWIETWLAERGEREGALVGLMERTANPSGATPDKCMYLRNVAHRAGMDYLTRVPQHIHAFPDSSDSLAARAQQITHVLDDILRKPAPPPRLAP